MIEAEQVHDDKVVSNVTNMQAKADEAVTSLREQLAKLHAIALNAVAGAGGIAASEAELYSELSKEKLARADLQAQVKSLQQELDASKAEQASCSEVIASLRSQVNASGVSGADRSIASEGGEVADLRWRMEALNAQVKSLQQELDACKAENAQCAEIIASLRSQVSGAGLSFPPREAPRPTTVVHSVPHVRPHLMSTSAQDAEQGRPPSEPPNLGSHENHVGDGDATSWTGRWAASFSQQPPAFNPQHLSVLQHQQQQGAGMDFSGLCAMRANTAKAKIQQVSGRSAAAQTSVRPLSPPAPIQRSNGHRTVMPPPRPAPLVGGIGVLREAAIDGRRAPLQALPRPLQFAPRQAGRSLSPPAVREWAHIGRRDYAL